MLYADRTEDCKNLRRRIIKQLVIKAEYMWMTDPQIAFGCNEGICLQLYSSGTGRSEKSDRTGQAGRTLRSASVKRKSCLSNRTISEGGRKTGRFIKAEKEKIV